MAGDFILSIPDFFCVIKQIELLVIRACDHLIVHQVTPEFPQRRETVTIWL
jgi:hypothetical protein